MKDYKKMCENLQHCAECLNDGDCCGHYKDFKLCSSVHEDILNAFIDCQNENKMLKNNLKTALRFLHGKCSVCINYSENHNQGKCRFCCYETARNPNVEVNDNWEYLYEVLNV